jgi:hypothetical protein
MLWRHRAPTGHKPSWSTAHVSGHGSSIDLLVKFQRTRRLIERGRCKLRRAPADINVMLDRKLEEYSRGYDADTGILAGVAEEASVLPTAALGGT